MNAMHVWAFAGSRELPLTTDHITALVRRVYYALAVPPVDATTTGDARGVDTSAALWSEEIGLPCMRFTAHWKRYGKAAGVIRTRQMLANTKPSVTVCVTLGTDPTMSPGTMHTWNMAQEMELPAVLFAYVDGKFRARAINKLQYRKEAPQC